MTHSNIRTLTPVFEGICFHKCLLRLNVSNNPTADEEEDRKKVMATF